jgi:hypothetical protein
LSVLLVVVGSQSHTVKFVNDNLEFAMKRMSTEKKKVENAAEKTGEAVGKGIKKGAKAVSDFGKSVKKELKKKE